MGKNQYTEIDKLFQSKLGKENIADGAWNEPTDDMFLAAMEKVNEQPEEVLVEVVKEDKKSRAILLLLLIPFIALLGFTLWNSMEVDQLKSTIQQMQVDGKSTIAQEVGASTITTEDKNEVVADAYANVSPTTNNTSTDNGSAAIKNKTVKTAATNRSAASIRSTASNRSNVSNNVFKKESNRIVNNIEGGIVPPSSDITSSNTQASSPISYNGLFAGDKKDVGVNASMVQASKERLSALNLIPGIAGTMNVAERAVVGLPMKAMPFAKVMEAESNAAKAFTLYGFFDLNVNTLRMSNVQTNGYSLSDYDKPYLGYNIGVGALQSINDRVSMNYNLSYRHVMNKSLYESQMKFDQNQLSVGVDGEMLYNVDMDFETPTGSLSLREPISMADGSIQHDEMMDQTTDIKQVFNFISLGVQPRVSLWKNEKINLFAEAGMNVNYLLSFCQHLDMKMYYHSDMMMEYPMEDHSTTDLNRLSLSASLGLGAEYQFNDHMYSSFRLGGSRSLNSIRHQENSSDNVGTFIDNLGVSLSAGYKF